MRREGRGGVRREGRGEKGGEGRGREGSRVVSAMNVPAHSSV